MVGVIEIRCNHTIFMIRKFKIRKPTIKADVNELWCIQNKAV